ncbi:ROK family protein [Xinfangfangia sp. D13-10-4-6]|uniref:glucokinase n=1 Tax=Pseudogemmobacter hezensis TaxID=2737662 RepID=UPI00155641F2|nr:ROK family protein [Pseudogemmobacter hezensis]NPD15622.1 ROK family protein [Pseudogemmobacter hezensis]
MSLAILADIGGTNTRVALSEAGKVVAGSIRRFPNGEYKARGEDIAAVLRDYLQGSGASVEGVCVAAAGPVQDGVATMTNLDWVMDADKLRRATGAARVSILNDLQAQGHALGHIPDTALRPLIDGAAIPGQTMLVVGLGTGVNAAPVYGQGAARVVPPSESGHMNMPVRNEEDFALMRFIEALLHQRGEIPHCGVEEVLAGRGLANLYSFATRQTGTPGAKSSAEILALLAENDPAALAAARLYSHILAGFLADLALSYLPWGGIYLIGGMARAMTPWFGTNAIADAFREPRRVDLLTHAFRVSVVEDDYAALTGCAAWLEASREA